MVKNKKYPIPSFERVAIDTASSKKCPMCETKNDQNAQMCKYCGYLFEDFSNAQMGTQSRSNYPTPLQNQEQQSPSGMDTTTPSSPDTFPISPQPTYATGSPLFVVSRSLVSTILPAIVYLVFILSFVTTSSFDLFSIGLIAVFILIAVLPILFTPRRYVFFDDSLRIHKIIGGDSEIPYADIVLQDYTAGRRQRIVLLAAGQRRPIVISGNPTNKELGQDLSQFLSKKLKKPNPQSANQEQSSPSQDTDSTTDARDETSND